MKMKVTCETDGIAVVCDGARYIQNDYSTIIIGGVFLGAVLLGLIALLVYKEYINQQWHRCLVEIGHEQAWLDVVKSVKKYIIPKKGERIGGAEPGLD